MFGNKEKRTADAGAREAAGAAFRAEVERLEALPMASLAAEVMAQGFGPDGYLPGFVKREPYAVQVAHVRNIAAMFVPEGARNAALYKRLARLVGEGLQVLEHESLVWARSVAEGSGIGYAPTRRGQAALDAGTVEQALRGE